MHEEGPRKEKWRQRVEDLPHALQILLPASSLLQSGVVEVLQLLQLRAPTIGGRDFLEFAVVAPETEFASLLLSFASASLTSAAAAAALRFKSPSEFVVFASPESDAGAATGAWIWIWPEGVVSEGEAALICSETVTAAERALLYVGHPEQAEAPPVPSQRPSPGQVPLGRFVVEEVTVLVDVVLSCDDGVVSSFVGVGVDSGAAVEAGWETTGAGGGDAAREGGLEVFLEVGVSVDEPRRRLGGVLISETGRATRRDFR